jgi:hypothetical protein
MKFEIFIDSAYYDMWCLKPEKIKNFDLTLHFNKEKEALFAKQVIEQWLEFQKQEFIDEFKRQHELHKHRHNYFLIAANMVKEKPKTGFGEKVTL